MVGFDGVTARLRSSAAVTVRFAVPETSPLVAVMVELPSLAPVASPALSMVATASAEEVQTTVALRSCVEVSENTPVAENC